MRAVTLILILTCFSLLNLGQSKSWWVKFRDSVQNIAVSKAASAIVDAVLLPKPQGLDQNTQISQPSNIQQAAQAVVDNSLPQQLPKVGHDIEEIHETQEQDKTKEIGKVQPQLYGTMQKILPSN